MFNLELEVLYGRCLCQGRDMSYQVPMYGAKRGWRFGATAEMMKKEAHTKWRFGVMTRILVPPYQLDGLHIRWRCTIDVPIRPYHWLFNKKQEIAYLLIPHASFY